MPTIETVTLGGGCFWRLEAVYGQMAGVVSVVSGYMGGSKPEPTYREACSGKTGHVEVVEIAFDRRIEPLVQSSPLVCQRRSPEQSGPACLRRTDRRKQAARRQD